MPFKPLSSFLSTIELSTTEIIFLIPFLFFDDDIVIFETEEILDIASPLKPLLVNENKSEDDLIFDVVCFKKHKQRSFLFIPSPSSLISIRDLPKSFTITLIFLALASIEFSISSFNTEEGR